jgi:formylmethanofuran dehydrogenase subunit A
MELLIKNGFVYDPINGVNGQKMDIAVKDGKIVERVNEQNAKIIDASGMTVMAGGVDLHSHIAGAEVNMARTLRPEDHYKDFERKTSVTRSGVGSTAPSVYTTGYRYSKMGYTTVMNPSMAAFKAKHAHEEMSEMPGIDKATYPLLGDWWFTLDALEKGNIEECAQYIAWMMNAVKGYAIKIVNPGGLEAWGFGKNVRSIDDQVPGYNLTPRDIIRGLCKVNKLLNMPHTIHLHTNNLGTPGNYASTLETMKCMEDLATDDKPVCHITHIHYSSIKGDSWMNMTSGAEEISNYVNNHTHITLDMGQIIFSDATTMTADGPFQLTLSQLSGHKWVNSDVEAETSGGIVPFHYRKKNYVNATQWATGLEIALMVKDPWKIFMTTDHPNGGPFTAYPKVLAWLYSKKARDATQKKTHPKAKKKSLLPSINRELSLYEIAIVTRAGPAKAIGLKDKGHLGIGAGADVAIFKINPEKLDITQKFRTARRAFAHAAYTIKDGEIIVKDGEVKQHVDGKTIWTDVQMQKPLTIDDGVRQKFKDYYSIEFENYPVTDHYLKKSSPIIVKASV